MKLKSLNLFLILFAPVFQIVINFLFKDQKATVLTGLFIFLFLLINLIFKKQKKEKYITHPLDDRFISIYIYIYLFFLTIISQNYLLNFEIIDWDISSYIVASNQISDGFLPNEAQWESKGPVLFYLYFFVLSLISGNYILFKIANDIVLFLIAVIFLKTSLVISNNHYLKSVVATTALVLFMSQQWALSGYSELYALVFLSLSLFFYKKQQFRNKYFVIGFCLSLATLINQGTILFIISFLLNFLITKVDFGKLVKFFAGFSLPHVFFLILYYLNGLIDVYIATFITIPLSYTSANYVNIYEILVFFRSFLEFNLGMYFLLLIIFLILFKNTILNTETLIDSIKTIEVQLIATSFLFYFIAAHNYYHHLIFFIYFISLYVSLIKVDYNFLTLTSFALLTMTTLLYSIGWTSINNLQNIDSVYDSYPIRQLAKDIEDLEIEDFEILALDYNLILHYLEEPNYSYIVHGTNFLEDYILSSLEDIEVIEKDYLNYLKDSKPKVIICSENMIVRGEIITQSVFPCNQDHLLDYYQINTEKYFTENLNYYRDPYKEIKLFIKR